MTTKLTRRSLAVALPCTLILAASLANAGIWRNSEPEPAPKRGTTTKQGTTTKKVTTTRQGTTTKHVTIAKSVRPTSHKATVTRATPVTRQSRTVRTGNTATPVATTTGAYGQTVSHSIHDWEPGSLNNQGARTASNESRRGNRGQSGAAHERAVEVDIRTLIEK